MEIWKPIALYENVYEISNTGLIKSLSRKVRTAKGFRIIRQRILKQKSDKDGYLLVNLNNSESKTFKVHRLVAISFVNNPHLKEEVNHLDGNKQNNNAWNLQWNTPKENCHHKNNELTKLDKRWKLTRSNVNFIRNHFTENPETKNIVYMSMFNISSSHLHRILNNKSWT